MLYVHSPLPSIRENTTAAKWFYWTEMKILPRDEFQFCLCFFFSQMDKWVWSSLPCSSEPDCGGTELEAMSSISFAHASMRWWYSQTYSWGYLLVLKGYSDVLGRRTKWCTALLLKFRLTKSVSFVHRVAQLLYPACPLCLTLWLADLLRCEPRRLVWCFSSFFVNSVKMRENCWETEWNVPKSVCGMRVGDVFDPWMCKMSTNFYCAFWACQCPSHKTGKKVLDFLVSFWDASGHQWIQQQMSCRKLFFCTWLW